MSLQGDIISPLDLRVVESSLEFFTPGTPTQPAWLEDSYENSKYFWKQLMASAASLHGSQARSVAAAKYDFFYDLLQRHGRGSQIALRWCNGNDTGKTISFEQLAYAASGRAATWSAQGACAAQCIAIVDSDPVEVAISVLAALKLGLVLSLVPPSGSVLVLERLQALEPDFIDSHSRYDMLLSPVEFPRLERKHSTAIVPDAGRQSFQYRSGQVVAKLFDVSSPDLCIPIEVTCDALYLGALRDGVLALGLRPGANFAAPGFSLLQVQPSLWFAGWLWGASFHQLDLDWVKQRKNLGSETKFRSLGISAGFRDILREKHWQLDKLTESWWQEPAQSGGQALWQELVNGLESTDVWHSRLRWQPAYGGCVLFSCRRKQQFHPGVWPSAGQPWQLMTPSAPEQPAVMDYGLLQMAGSETPATQNLLVRGRGEFLFSKVVDTVRGGYFYPQDFLQNALLDLEACTDISLVLVPAYGADEALRVDLLVFTDPIVCSVLGLEETELAATIKRRISGQLGTEYLPERIEFFGLFPRRDAEGGVDHRWCKKQYLTGALHRSARQEIYQRVSELRRRCQP